MVRCLRHSLPVPTVTPSMDNLPYFDLYFNPWNEDTIALNTNPPSSSPRDENVNTEAGSRKNLDAVNEECNTENYLKSFHNYLANNIHLYHGIDNILPGDYEINDGMESSSEQYESNEDNTLNRRGAYYAKLPARYFSKSKRQVPEEYNISNEQLENDGSDAFGRGDPCTAPTPGGVSLLVQQMRNFKQAPNAFLSSPGDENADNSFETELQENPDAANNATSRTYETANGHAAPSKHEHSDDSSESSQQSSGSFSRSHHNKFVKPIFIDSSVRHGGNIGGSYVLAAGGVIAMKSQ
ncbi:hypothetical protein BDQ17DRAFT_340834 [Cyathus striatus]|nr:hypothetical protein BDQ17DRAFT_340834 [Cyathus striatus]